MANIFSTIKNMFSESKLLPSGMYHYQSPADDPKNYRLHLRLENNGEGLLIINAATILHLNQTAAEIAYYYVHKIPEVEAIDKITKRYHVSKEQAQKDYLDFVDRIDILINTPDLDPVTFLDFERHLPYTGATLAPYRLDCAITYRLPVGSNLMDTPTKRVSRELTTDEWKIVIKKAWDAGIPQIVFTGGEPTLREDLIELITYVEKNGQVAGLLTDGLHLVEKRYLQSLLMSGLDHLMILLDINNKNSWIALENSLAEDIFVSTHITINDAITPEIRNTLIRLYNIGIKGLSLSITNEGLINALNQAKDIAADYSLPMIWDVPVPYSNYNPISMEIIPEEIARGAGHAWLYVEPDGDVLPAQGITSILGNLLNDTWDKIWEAAKQYTIQNAEN